MTEQVRAIRLRPTLSTVLDSATNSDGEIFFDSNNQTLRIFDNGISALVATRTWTTSSISTAIAAIPASSITNDDINWIPYDQLIDLPSASANHGMFAHVHGTGKAYYAHAGAWIELANASDVADSGLALTDLSVGAAASASGSGAIAYNNTTGVFTYTPPDLSTYLSSVAFSDLTSTPTTVAGYGITDAFDGVFGSLTSTPTTVAGYGITDITTAVTTALGSSNLTDFSDVTITTPSDGQVLKYSSGQWVNAADLTGAGGSGISLSDLSVSVNAAGTANLAYNNVTGVFAYTPPNLSSYLTAITSSNVTTALGYTPLQTETNDLSTAVTWANIPDANVPASAVTQHQAALSITESQISDLGTYLTTVGVLSNHTDVSATVPSTGQVLKWSGTEWAPAADALGEGGSGIALTDLSVGAAASASGSGALAYNNTTGVFTYTPPLLSSYATTASLATVATSGAYSDLSGTPSIPVATLPAITKLTVTANGSSAYRFDQYGTADNPTIYAISATTIAFDLTGASGHPFLIQTSGGANYDTGLVHIDTDGTTTTGAAAQGKGSGTLYWKIPIGTTGNYRYICQLHGAMVGVIAIKDFVTL
jgi:plastocyanin